MNVYSLHFMFPVFTESPGRLTATYHSIRPLYLVFRFRNGGDPPSLLRVLAITESRVLVSCEILRLFKSYDKPSWAWAEVYYFRVEEAATRLVLRQFSAWRPHQHDITNTTNEHLPSGRFTNTSHCRESPARIPCKSHYHELQEEVTNTIYQHMSPTQIISTSNWDDSTNTSHQHKLPQQ